MSFLSGRKEEARLAMQAAEDIWGMDRYEAGSAANAKLPVRERATGSSTRSNPGSDGQKMSCANPGCSSSWAKPWKNRRRPIFEGQWGCGSRCLQALIRGAVRRETGDGLAAVDDAPHRHRVPLGLLMLAKGWITQPQLRRALEGRRQPEGRLASGCSRIAGLGATR